MGHLKGQTLGVVYLAGSGDVSKFFNSKTHSDVILKTKDWEMPAHKVILSAGSEYFRACFESGFKEAHETTMTIDEEYSEGLYCLIELLYGSLRPGYNPPFSPGRIPAFKQNIDLYIVAQKYLVPQARDHADMTFEWLLENVDTQHAEYPRVLAETVAYVYGKAADEAEALRRPLVRHYVDHVKDVEASEHFRDVLTENAEFAADVAGKLMRSAVRKSERANKRRKTGEVEDSTQGGTGGT